MKKLFLLLLLTGLFIACGDDDNEKGDNGGIPLSDWKGDWNDPTDPAYKPEYNGAYFPIKGTWKVIEKNGKAYDKYYICEFEDGSRYKWNYLDKTADQMYCSPRWSSLGYNQLFINDTQLKVSYNITNPSKMESELFNYNIIAENNRQILTITDRKETYKLIEYTAEDADKDGWCEWPR